MLQGLLLILAFLLLGEGTSRALALPVPGSVIGMLLLAAALRARVVSGDVVRPAAETLVQHLAPFFIPAAVAVAQHGPLLRAQRLRTTARDARRRELRAP